MLWGFHHDMNFMMKTQSLSQTYSWLMGKLLQSFCFMVERRREVEKSSCTVGVCVCVCSQFKWKPLRGERVQTGSNNDKHQSIYFSLNCLPTLHFLYALASRPHKIHICGVCGASVKYKYIVDMKSWHSKHIKTNIASVNWCDQIYCVAPLNTITYCWTIQKKT